MGEMGITVFLFFFFTKRQSFFFFDFFETKHHETSILSFFVFLPSFHNNLIQKKKKKIKLQKKKKRKNEKLVRFSSTTIATSGFFRLQVEFNVSESIWAENCRNSEKQIYKKSRTPRQKNNTNNNRSNTNSTPIFISHNICVSNLTFGHRVGDLAVFFNLVK